jgi:hypothetical protein
MPTGASSRPMGMALPTEVIDDPTGRGTVRGAFDNDGPPRAAARPLARYDRCLPKETSGDYTPIMRETPRRKTGTRIYSAPSSKRKI